MNLQDRKALVNNILRANNELIDKKWLLNNNIKNQISVRTDIHLVNHYPYIRGIETTIKNIFLSELKKQEEKLRSDIEILRRYIRLRTTLLIGIKKINGKYKYRFFGESIIKNNKIVVLKKTISKGSPIDYISTHDLNKGIINLCELIINHKKEIIDTIDYFFEIRTGRLIPLYKEKFKKYYSVNRQC